MSIAADPIAEKRRAPRLSQDSLSDLCCPACRAHLEQTPGGLRCENAACDARYPMVDGVPVLINEPNKLFSINIPTTEEVRAAREEKESDDKPGISSTLVRTLPKLGRNVKAEPNYAHFLRLLLEKTPTPKVLVVGGRIKGQGMDVLINHPGVELVETDICVGPRVGLICDAHHIPFPDGSFDGVVIQAVLPNLADPAQGVAEIHRVLREDGLVYAEAGFLQAVQDGAYDFWRFTLTGLRRTFNRFEEIDAGATCGPGMAMARLYERFLMNLFDNRHARRLASLFARLTAFWLKYLDPYLLSRPAGADAASGVYFLGRRIDRVAPDREIVARYCAR